MTKRVVSDREAYWAIKALSPIAQKFIDETNRHELGRFVYRGELELVSAIRMFRAQLKRRSVELSANRFRFRFGDKILTAIRRQLGNGEKWRLEINEESGAVHITFGARAANTKTVFKLYPGFKLVKCEDSVFIYRHRQHKQTETAKIFSLQVIKADGSKQDCFGCMLRGEDKIRLLTQRTVETAAKAAEELYKKLWFERADAALAG